MYFKSNTNILEYNNDSILYESFCEECINAYIKTGNEEYFDSILNEDLFHKAKRLIRQNKGKVAIGASILGTLGNALYTGNKMVGDLDTLNTNLEKSTSDDEDYEHTKKTTMDIIGHGLAGGARQVGLLGVGTYGVGTGTKHYIEIDLNL